MSYFQNRYITRWAGILSFIYIVHVFGCAPLEIKEGIFSPPHRKYTVDLPGKGWEAIRMDKEDVALWHKQYRAMIALISSDIESKGLSLEMLKSQLFIGMKNKEILLGESVLVDNQKAMHTVLTCEMDNNKFKIASYIIRMEDRVYDLLYWTSPDSFDCLRGDFEDMVMSFRFLRSEEPFR